MRPAQVLKFYLLGTFLCGLVLCLPVFALIAHGDIEREAGVLLIFCWNVLCLLVMPLILDWSEQKYCKARFLAMEELAKENPELKAFLDLQCEKLALETLRFAITDIGPGDILSYGLLKHNPRLIVPASFIADIDKTKTIPSIELELNRFAKQEISLYFLGFAVCQAVLLVGLDILF